jgi:GR25 family glycosyltransferase involved in LPS biosynthesis
MENIAQVIYINLDKREDRKQRIEQELERAKIVADQRIRYSANSYKGSPNAGCLESHANVLSLAFELGFENVLILEDDFVFIDDTQKIHQDISYFFNTVSADWDVIMLTTCSPVPAEPVRPIYTRICSSTNGAGYLVNRRMMMRLSKLFKDNVENLYQTGAHWQYQNDILWKDIMSDPNVKWYMFNRYLGYQKEGHSDLSNDHKISIIPQILAEPEENVVYTITPTAPTALVEPDTKYTPCSVVNSVINSFISRANFGYQKYGQTLDRTDLSLLDWIQHAQEEHMDAILYLEKIKKELSQKTK